MPKITSIDLVFENVESIRVMKHHKATWSNIDVSAHIDAIGQRFNTISVDSAKIDFDLKDVLPDGLFDKNQSILDRILGGDISHFDINYDDGSNIYLGLPWAPEDEYTNLYQKTKVYNNDKSIRLSFKERPLQ